MKLKLRHTLLALSLCILCTGQASALEYKLDAPGDFLFAQPTTQEEPIRAWENPNTDRSKDVSLIPPGFGSATSGLPNSGQALTPNLIPGALNGGLVTETGSVNRPSINGGIPNPVSEMTTTQTAQTTAYTGVTSNLYYANGQLGVLKIPAIGVNVKVFEGTGSSTLAKGAGHFPGTSIWNGNIAVAGHNRGTNCYFGNIHTLKAGNIITLTTKLGTRNYTVTSVSKVLETDTSGTAATSNNQITLYTCVRNQSAYRWCVKGVQI